MLPSSKAPKPPGSQASNFQDPGIPDSQLPGDQAQAIRASKGPSNQYTIPIQYTNIPIYQYTCAQAPTALRCTTLHYTTLHHTKLHCTTLHYITLHCITLHYTALHSNALHYITLHHITLYYITLHYIALHYLTLHSKTYRKYMDFNLCIWKSCF